MTTLSGAILVLGACVVFAAALMAHAMARTDNPQGVWIGFFVAIVVGLLGLGIMIGGATNERRRKE
jgi:hypothetical protein